jgi:hypothetical protein
MRWQCDTIYGWRRKGGLREAEECTQHSTAQHNTTHSDEYRVVSIPMHTHVPTTALPFL